MADREIRDSQHACPQCGTTLRQVWVYGDDGSIVHNKEWQPVGRPTCPLGHRIEWTAAGPA
jgi:hypothetical protein